MSVTGTWRKKEKRSQDSTLSATGSLFFCILCLVLFKTAVTSLLLNWVLFLANSSSSQSRPCGNCHDHLQSLQSNTWEIIDWASVKLVFLFFSPFSFFLFPRVSTIETKSMGTKKKRSESLNPFPVWMAWEPNCLALVWANLMWKFRNSCGLSWAVPEEMWEMVGNPKTNVFSFFIP